MPPRRRAPPGEEEEEEREEEEEEESEGADDEEEVEKDPLYFGQLTTMAFIGIINAAMGGAFRSACVIAHCWAGAACLSREEDRSRGGAGKVKDLPCYTDFAKNPWCALCWRRLLEKQRAQRRNAENRKKRGKAPHPDSDGDEWAPTTGPPEAPKAKEPKAKAKVKEEPKEEQRPRRSEQDDRDWDSWRARRKKDGDWDGHHTPGAPVPKKRLAKKGPAGEEGDQPHAQQEGVAVRPDALQPLGRAGADGPEAERPGGPIPPRRGRSCPATGAPQRLVYVGPGGVVRSRAWWSREACGRA